MHLLFSLCMNHVVKDACVVLSMYESCGEGCMCCSLFVWITWCRMHVLFSLRMYESRSVGRVSTEVRRHGIPRNFLTSEVISAQFRRNSAKFRGIPRNFAGIAPEITSVFRGMPKCHFRGHPKCRMHVLFHVQVITLFNTEIWADSGIDIILLTIRTGSKCQP